MLPENLRQNAIATAVEAFDADAVITGKLERGELTLEIAPGKILSICGFLKYDQTFVRLSSVTAVDRYPSEPRFEVVYHLHSVQQKQRIRLKCRVYGAVPLSAPAAPARMRTQSKPPSTCRSIVRPMPRPARRAARRS